MGKVSSIELSNGNVTTFSYDDNGRPVSSNDSRGVYSLTYDAAGNILTRTDPNGNTTSYEYDKLNLMKREIYDDTTFNSYTYYPEGQMKSIKDRNGNVTSYEYNEVGLLTKRDFPGTNDDIFTYDTRGQLLTANNNNANISFTYDNDGRLLKETLNGNSINYNYDLDNKYTEITYPGGRKVKKQYDARGRINKIVEGTVDHVSFFYNPNNDVTQIKYANGDSIDYSYNSGKPSQITHKNNGNVFLDYRFSYNQGLISKEDRLVDSGDKSYEYDSANRLIKYVQGTPVNKTDNYTLDGLGNWTNFNGVNRAANNLNQYTNVNGNRLSYDLNGNLVEDINNMYEYDYMNRLTKVTEKSGGSIVQYEYDAMGRRTASIKNGIKTEYFYNQFGSVIEEQAGGVTKATYIAGNNIPNIFSMDRAGKRYYYHRDIRNSVVKINDGNGNLVEEYNYDAYGNMSILDASGVPLQHSAIGNPFGFAGAAMDTDTGLAFMMNRYYSPSLGRFTSVDSLGYVDGGNLYEYGRSDPVNQYDVLGLSPEKCFKTQDIQFSADTKIKALMNKFKIGGIALTTQGAGVTFSLSDCTKECCTSDGNKITSPVYHKGSLEADFTLGGRGPAPSLSFSAPVIGDVGLFVFVSVSIKGSAAYEESATSNCTIKKGGKACVKLAGNIGLQLGAAFADGAIEAWLKGQIGPSGEVCYGSDGFSFTVCINAGITLEYSVEVSWWKYGNSFNVLSGKVCLGTGGFSGSYQFLFWETNFGD